MEKVLIVEDDRSTRMIIAKSVKDTGNIPLFSPDGQHAIESLEADRDIKLVISDIMMPRMDGRQLVQVMRGHKKLRKIPVILVSGVVGIKEISDLMKLGVSRFQPKPIKPKELKEAICCCLEEG